MQQSMNGQCTIENGQLRIEDGERQQENDNFNIYGPTYLKNVDWRNQNHARSIMASLSKGVYVSELDRQQGRTGDKALGTPWWNFFQFQCNKILIDQIDHSIFGAIFEYKPHAPYQQGVPPGKYIVVFRGTCLQPETKKRDLYLDSLIAQDRLTEDYSRYQVAFQEINAMLSKVDPKDVLLSGHSLGAAIAFQAGKEKAKKGCLINSYLFNPPVPFWIDPNTGELKSNITGLDLSNMASKYDSKTQQNDLSFQSLCSWIPSLFTHPNDIICNWYIRYFEQRDKKEELRSEKVDHIASKNSLSLMTMLANSSGRQGEPSFAIPSALLVKNMDGASMLEAHALELWWKQDSNCQSKLYKYGQY